jgi:hypothetical protein
MPQPVLEPLPLRSDSNHRRGAIFGREILFGRSPLPDSGATSGPATSGPATSGAAAAAPPAAAHARLLRTLLVAGCVLSVCVALCYGDPAGYLQSDPALARLLRGMALIKGAIGMAAIALVLWRYGWPISRAAAVSYALGCAVLAGCSALIWQLTWIAPAAVLFHAGLIGMLILGWRES